MKMSGVIKKYTGNGRRLGFPTANIELREADSIKDGLYCGITTLNSSQLFSVIYVGAPEIYNDKIRRLESYILDFPDIDLYGKSIEVEILHRLRDNKPFDSEELLIAQMKKDEVEARKFFKTYVHRHNNPHD